MTARRDWWIAGGAALLFAFVLWILVRKSPNGDPAPIPPSPAPDPVVEELVPMPPEPPPIELVAPPATIQVVVRDLYDGRPIPGLAFRTSVDAPATAATGDDGLLDVVPSMLGDLRPAHADWRLVRDAFPAAEGRPTLWLYRMIGFHGRVVGRSDVAELELDPKSVGVSLVGAGEAASPSGARPRLDSNWFSGHHLYRINFVVKGVAADGSFQTRVPRLPGLHATAFAPGWVPASIPLPVETDPARGEFLLDKSSLTISGVVRDQAGSPVAGIGVQGYVIVRMPTSEFDPAVPATSGHGYASLVHPERGARIFYFLSGRTDAEGRFMLSSNVSGELQLVTTPTDVHRAAWASLPRLDDDVEGLDLVLEPGDGTFVEFRRSGVPLRNEGIVLHDQTKEVQTTHQVKLDEDGRCPSSHLDRGHRIRIRLRDQARIGWYVEWDGRRVVDLDQFPTHNPWLGE